MDDQRLIFIDNGKDLMEMTTQGIRRHIAIIVRPSAASESVCAVLQYTNETTFVSDGKSDCNAQLTP